VTAGFVLPERPYARPNKWPSVHAKIIADAGGCFGFENDPTVQAGFEPMGL